jgi:hypothetical protein
VAAVLVAKRQGQEEVRDGREARGRDARRAGGSEPRDASDRVAQSQEPGGAIGSAQLLVSGAWNVRETRPNLSTSPFATATGTPVVKRVPLTYVPFMTPISSMT